MQEPLLNDEPIEYLVRHLSKLPSIGKKSAQRLVFHLLNSPVEDVRQLTDAIQKTREMVRSCEICHNYALDTKCKICLNTSRKHNLICVVEKPADILSLERFGAFSGVYHVLGGCLSPLDGIGPADLNIGTLFSRIKDQSAPELVFALNTNSDGEATILYLKQKWAGENVKMSRLARGIPVGSDLQYIDDSTIQQAMEYREPL